MYNDQSVLENMHTSKLFEILNKNATNMLAGTHVETVWPWSRAERSFATQSHRLTHNAGLDSEQWKAARKNIVECILETDMSRHAKLICDAKIFCELNVQASCMHYHHTMHIPTTHEYEYTGTHMHACNAAV